MDLCVAANLHLHMSYQAGCSLAMPAQGIKPQLQDLNRKVLVGDALAVFPQGWIGPFSTSSVHCSMSITCSPPPDTGLFTSPNKTYDAPKWRSQMNELEARVRGRLLVPGMI